ncbi:M20 family metallopeptidase [Brevibacillus massiliensis]|jgi:glutamate carboxypeptidase|uniref:M20 family metallopeptidase n=1 Tax=Brevibacillus massiliensis TaxID=1118054 RepID=UPI0002FDDC94|nr:M20 family metallopeptidase [Brevibacillus massiliensis]
MADILSYLQANQQHMLADLESVVKAESPSNDKEQVDRCGAVLQSLFQSRLGVDGEVIPQTKTGDHLRFAYGDGDHQILITTHFDTVWDVGRLNYRVEGNKAYGPGIFDMKGGIIQSLWALKACRDLGIPLDHKIVFLCTSDEEIGSGTSRDLIEQEALKSQVVLVPEPAVAETGALKTARKGVGSFVIKLRGRASHAGNHHEDGISAVDEMARQILFLHSLTDYSKGTTLNVGIAHGGNRVNVVAEQAELHVDLRVTSLAEAERISSLIQAAKPQREGIIMTVEGGIERPPMERTAGVGRLFHLAAEAAGELGFALTEAAVGGGSDGNFTSALGIPTLDGLGAVGDGPHAEYEHVRIDQLPIRAALFAKLLAKL